MMRKLLFILFIFFFLISGFSCRENFTPKPRGYPRIDFPEKVYTLYNSSKAFSFDYPVYAEVVPDRSVNAEQDWLNINFTQMNGTIYLSYKTINKNLDRYIEDSRNFVYKHAIKAEHIPEIPFYRPESKVYGILYDIKGNAASSVQFFITDSTMHFVRGSLYFDTQPDKDSLAPVIQFVREDIVHMINTFQWK